MVERAFAFFSTEPLISNLIFLFFSVMGLEPYSWCEVKSQFYLREGLCTHSHEFRKTRKVFCFPSLTIGDFFIVDLSLNLFQVHARGVFLY